MPRRFAVALLMCSLGTAVSAGNWPQWRGPLADGTSSERDLPVRWSENENIAWKAGIRGVGISSPIVWGDTVIVTSQFGGGSRRPGRHPTLVQGGDAAAAGEISEWVRNNVRDPVIVGPDSESEQWVSEVAQMAGAPFVVLEKTRRGDRDVSVSPIELDGPHRDRTPVLVDDIISTARTMIETVHRLRELDIAAPVCIGVHAIFAGDAYDELMGAGAARVVTCNTIPHPTNGIDVSGLFVDFITGHI